MSLQEVFAAINQMRSDDVIDRYAIGGAVGATFYLEPVSTLDVDVFIGFRTEAGQLLTPLTSIFEYLTKRGAAVEGEHLVIAGWPVQFLPPTGPLVDEALTSARQDVLEGESVWVFTAEHLAAIALETGRAKDKARVLQFVEEGVLDPDRFEEILTRHGLMDRWKRFEQQFLREQQ